MTRSATPQETIEALLERSGRDHLPLAGSFVQGETSDGRPRPGPLADFVAARALRPLHLYLLAHASASATLPGQRAWSVTHDSRVWARALGLDPTYDGSRTAVSKTWAWLAERRLIDRRRVGRLVEITLLRDDGTGRAYGKHPAQRNERYFKLPYAFWRGRWHERLDLAATAILLIGLSRNGPFELPQDRVGAWYGISGSTLTKGLGRLRSLDLLDVHRHRRPAPLAPEGYTWTHTYTLLEPFAPAVRRKRRTRQRGGAR